MDHVNQKVWSVYVHVFPNGKRYVGITSKDPVLRWGTNGSGYCGQKVYYAIKKYGWNNIQHIILDQCDSQQKAKELEKHYIQKYGSYDFDKGYNRTLGGDSVAEGINNIQVYKYDIYGNYICKYNSMTQAAKDNNTVISIVSRICSGIKKNTRDITFRDSYQGEKIKPIVQQVDRLEYKFIPVTQYSLNGVKIKTYPNYIQAGKSNNYPNHLYEGIINCCLGKGNTSRGYIWKFGDCQSIDVSDIDFVRGMWKKTIYQYDLNGTFLNKYESLMQASRTANCNVDSISNCLRGLCKSSGGYMWFYEYKGENVAPYHRKKRKNKRSRKCL